MSPSKNDQPTAPANGTSTSADAEKAATTPRRDVLIAGGMGIVGGVAGTLLAQNSPRKLADRAREQESDVLAIPSAGAHQAGVSVPVDPQSHSLITVVRVLDHAPSAMGPLLAELGTRILRLTSAEDYDELTTPDGPGDLTIHVGLGPAPLAAVDPALPGAEPMPLFIGDTELPETHLNGDLLIAAHASDPVVLEPVRAALLGGLSTVEELWSEHGLRGPSDRGTVRNPLGFHDGIIIPRDEEVDESVWITEGLLAGGSVCVIRKLRLDIEAFWAEPLDRQNEVIGRNKLDGTPLSGGEMEDEVNLFTKAPTGEFLTPARSHARAAHPSFTGNKLMLRRSYGYAANREDRGLLFICFQNDVKVFSDTQLRMDEVDDLVGYTTTLASGSFVILPGFTPGTALGASLY